jgi:hypothetical protein
LVSPWFVLLGVACQFAGSARYVVQTLRGLAIPNRVTWTLWAIAPLIAFAGELSKGVGLQSLLTLTVGLSPAVVLAASYTRHAGRWDLTRFDILCGALSVIGIVLWQLSGDGSVAIGLSLGADFLAATPTLIKVWRAPHTEEPGAFIGAFLSALITLFTIKHWTFAVAAWPAYLLVMSAVLVLLYRAGSTRRASKQNSLPSGSANTTHDTLSP